MASWPVPKQAAKGGLCLQLHGQCLADVRFGPKARVATPLLKVKADAVSLDCPVKPTLGVKMIQLQRGFVTAILIATAPLATSIPLGSPALAATCASAAQRCIAQSKDKADRVERCTAARQSCETSGVFVGPYTGDRYTLQKTGGVVKSCNQSGPYGRNRACY
jgi:hypothetical protein